VDSACVHAACVAAVWPDDGALPEISHCVCIIVTQVSELPKRSWMASAAQPSSFWQ
jgi:hypothetical protein